MSTNPATRGGKRGVSRRGLLGAGAGIAAGAATLAVLPGSAFGSSGVTVEPAKRGIQLYTVRDIVTRAPNRASGIEGGFRYVFEQLSKIGFTQVEFAGYTQSTSILGRQITPQEIRQLLDDNGLHADGSHIAFSDDTIEQQLDTAEILGLKHLGTAMIPTNLNRAGTDPTLGRYKWEWETAAVNFNRWGELAAKRGIKLYQHNHHDEYNFLLDSGPLDSNGNPTRSSGLRGLDYFFTLTDPRYVWFEMDIYWGYVAQHRYATYTDANGVSQTSIFDPLAVVQAQPHRFPLFHVKDGAPAPDTANGYNFVPVGTGVLPLRSFLNSVAEKGYHYPTYEQDNAPGDPVTAPYKSLQDAQTSYNTIASWR